MPVQSIIQVPGGVRVVAKTMIPALPVRVIYTTVVIASAPVWSDMYERGDPVEPWIPR